MTPASPLSYDPAEPQYPQVKDWTCSACSLAWLNRALLIDYATTEPTAVDYIGYPEHINDVYGLMDGSGARLAACLREQGAPALCLWPSFDTCYQLARHMPLLIGGQAWYHWVGVRGVTGDALSLANSAPGWQGVDQVLTRADYERLGPFAGVAVPLLVVWPQIRAALHPV